MCAFWHGKCWRCLDVKVELQGSMCEACQDTWHLTMTITPEEFLSRLEIFTTRKLRNLSNPEIIKETVSSIFHPDDFCESHDDFLTRIRAEQITAMQKLVDLGLFESITEDGAPIPHPQVFSISQMEDGATMANIMVEMGIFPSLTQARKNGWNKPLVLGRHIIHKKTKVSVLIVE